MTNLETAYSSLDINYSSVIHDIIQEDFKKEGINNVFTVSSVLHDIKRYLCFNENVFNHFISYKYEASNLNLDTRYFSKTVLYNLALKNYLTHSTLVLINTEPNSNSNYRYITRNRYAVYKFSECFNFNCNEAIDYLNRTEDSFKEKELLAVEIDMTLGTFKPYNGGFVSTNKQVFVPIQAINYLSNWLSNIQYAVEVDVEDGGDAETYLISFSSQAILKEFEDAEEVDLNIVNQKIEAIKPHYNIISGNIIGALANSTYRDYSHYKIKLHKIHRIRKLKPILYDFKYLKKYELFIFLWFHCNVRSKDDMLKVMELPTFKMLEYIFKHMSKEEADKKCRKFLSTSYKYRRVDKVIDSKLETDFTDSYGFDDVRGIVFEGDVVGIHEIKTKKCVGGVFNMVIEHIVVDNCIAFMALINDKGFCVFSLEDGESDYDKNDEIQYEYYKLSNNYLRKDSKIVYTKNTFAVVRDTLLINKNIMYHESFVEKAIDHLERYSDINKIKEIKENKNLYEEFKVLYDDNIKFSDNSLKNINLLHY